MGLGNVVINVGWKAVVLVIFAALLRAHAAADPRRRVVGLGR